MRRVEDDVLGSGCRIVVIAVLVMYESNVDL